METRKRIMEPGPTIFVKLICYLKVVGSHSVEFIATKNSYKESGKE
jgi:hypothetical protein